MNNIELYNKAFIETFGVNESSLNNGFSKDNVDSWDSVHQLSLVTMIEDAFDIMFDPEDIMAMVSYEAGFDILTKYDIILK